jgi:hypothetical protein
MPFNERQWDRELSVPTRIPPHAAVELDQSAKRGSWFEYRPGYRQDPNRDRSAKPDPKIQQSNRKSRLRPVQRKRIAQFADFAKGGLDPLLGSIHGECEQLDRPPQPWQKDTRPGYDRSMRSSNALIPKSQGARDRDPTPTVHPIRQGSKVCDESYYVNWQRGKNSFVKSHEPLWSPTCGSSLAGSVGLPAPGYR